MGTKVVHATPLAYRQLVPRTKDQEPRGVSLGAVSQLLALPAEVAAQHRGDPEPSRSRTRRPRLASAFPVSRGRAVRSPVVLQRIQRRLDKRRDRLGHHRARCREERDSTLIPELLVAQCLARRPAVTSSHFPLWKSHRWRWIGARMECMLSCHSTFPQAVSFLPLHGRQKSAASTRWA